MRTAFRLSDLLSVQINRSQRKRKERECGTDKKKQTGQLTAGDLPAINAIIAKGDRAEVGPGPNGTVKISHVKRIIVKSGR